MLKTLLGIAGIALFAFCIFVGVNVFRGETQASALDDVEKKFGMVTGPPFCNWKARLPERVMSEDKSQAIVVRLENVGAQDCESSITLRAPDFDISPFKEDQNIKLSSKGKGSMSWILSPRESGAYEITVSDALNTSILGVTVTNIFGLTSVQAKLFSAVGGLFGPMMTVPWWWDRARRKSKPDFPKAQS